MGKLAFVFPGQGSQYVGMGAHLVKDYPLAADIFSLADSILGWSISSLCFNGPTEELSMTINSQPAIFTLSCVYLALLGGILPDYVAGHSLGEYSAVVASKVLSFADTLKLVRARAELMNEAAQVNPGVMVAVIGLETSTIEELVRENRLAGVIEIANYNCPGQVVISGEERIVDQVGIILKEAGAKRLIKLAVSGAFHSSLVKPAEVKFERVLETFSFRDAELPIVSNYTARPTVNALEIKENLAKQISAPVLWEKSVREMIDLGVDTFVELGPGKVIQGLIKRISPDVSVISVEEAGLNRTRRELAG